MVDETIPEKCETLYNKLNSFVESEISRDVTPQISNLNSRIDALEPNLVRVKEVSGNISSVSAGGTSTKTFTVPACPSGYNWEYFSTSTGWGTVSSVSLSGTTLTVTLLNVSNSSHDISFSGVLMYYPTTIEAEQHISLVATNPYLLESEVTDLVVSLVDEFGLPLANKSVTVSDGSSSYNGITNNQGIFTLPDISVSTDTTFTATYSGATDSCLVEYCRFVDYAVKDKHNHNYFNQAGTSNVTITEADGYKEFKTISTTAGNIYLGSSTSFTGFDVGNTWTIIYDKLYVEGYNVAFQCYNGSTTVGINSTTLGSHNSDFQELKFVCDGSSIKVYVDGVYKAQTSYTSTGHGYLRINLNNNNGASQVTFRAKNIRIK